MTEFNYLFHHSVFHDGVAEFAARYFHMVMYGTQSYYNIHYCEVVDFDLSKH